LAQFFAFISLLTAFLLLLEEIPLRRREIDHQPPPSPVGGASTNVLLSNPKVN